MNKETKKPIVNRIKAKDILKIDFRFWRDRNDERCKQLLSYKIGIYRRK